jgi:hypothetical protein
MTEKVIENRTIANKQAILQITHTLKTRVRIDIIIDFLLSGSRVKAQSVCVMCFNYAPIPRQLFLFAFRVKAWNIKMVFTSDDQRVSAPVSSTL